MIAAVDKDWWKEYRSDDPIARLFVHYYGPCDLMYRQRKAIRQKMQRLKRPNRKLSSDDLSYTKLWLSMLRVVCEGFADLKMKDEEIESTISEHLPELNLFRNGVFHYQKGPDKLTQFISAEGDTFAWAENLHRQFARLESRYRVENAVRNLQSVIKT